MLDLEKTAFTFEWCGETRCTGIGFTWEAFRVLPVELRRLVYEYVPVSAFINDNKMAPLVVDYQQVLNILLSEKLPLSQLKYSETERAELGLPAGKQAVCLFGYFKPVSTAYVEEAAGSSDVYCPFYQIADVPCFSLHGETPGILVVSQWPKSLVRVDIDAQRFPFILPKLTGMPNLVYFGLENYSRAKRVAQLDFSGCISLSEINVRNCLKIDRVAGLLDARKSLARVAVVGCPNVSVISGLHALPNLYRLDVSGTHNLSASSLPSGFAGRLFT